MNAVNALPGGKPLVNPELRHLPDPANHPRFVFVGDYLFDSTLNGVLDSAEWAADHILKHVERPVPSVSEPALRTATIV